MRKKFQEGGLAMAQDEQDPATGYLGLIASQFQTSHEAQQRAREILDQYGGEERFAQQEEILERFRETAEESREALRQARAKVLGREYDQRKMWLAAAQALGSPTKTGQFGEQIGLLAGALRGPMDERSQFEKDKADRLLELDQAITGIDQSMLANELGVAQSRSKYEADLMKEALKTLGKSVTGAGKVPPQLPGPKSLDQKMSTIALDWMTKERADARKSLSELSEVLGAITQSDTISGPWVGSLPKWARELGFPESVDTQELVETTAQRSLKAVLGGQFGQREGEMLLQRTFNPRLDERVNRRRAHRLYKMLEEAAQEKSRMVAYFMDQGTLQGYEGKTEWTLEDFEPEPEIITYRMKDGGLFDAPDTWTRRQIEEAYERSKETTEGEPQQFKRGGKVRRRGTSFRAKYYQGGAVDIDEAPEEDAVEIEDVGDDGFTPMDLLRAAGITGAGTLAGIGAEEVGTRLQELNRQVERPPRSQQLIGTAMERGNVTPTEMVTEVKRGQRVGVPEVPLDVSGRIARELGERAIMAAGDVGDEALDMLIERHQQSRHRVRRQVEKGLRTPEFYTTEDKLTNNLYSRAKPFYEKAFEATVPTPNWWGEMYNSKYGQKAIELALEMMEESGRPIGKANVAGFVEKPTLEFMDWVKRGYDQQIMAEEKGTFTSTPVSRIMKQQRSRLVTFLDKNGPDEYKKARAQYKGDAEVLEALHTGRDVYYRMPAEEARRMIQDMSFAEKQALRTGFAQRLYEIIYAPSTDIAAARRLIGSPEMATRLELLFDKPREFRVFKAALQREMEMWERNKRMIRGTERGRQRRQIGEVMEMDDPLNAIKQQIGRGPTMWALRMLPPYGSKKPLTEKEADEIVRIMTTGDIAELERIRPQLDYATEYAKKRNKRRGKAGMIGAAIGAAIAALPDDEDE